jgi:hypothetical protein
MKVRYANGEVSSVRNDLGRELVRAGLCTVLEQEPEVNPNQRPRYAPGPAPESRWFITIENYDDALCPGKKVLAVRMDCAQQVAYYFGQPEHINACIKWEGGQRFVNGFGRAVPESVAVNYARQWESNPHLRLPDAVLRGGV